MRLLILQSAPPSTLERERFSPWHTRPLRWFVYQPQSQSDKAVVQAANRRNDGFAACRGLVGPLQLNSGSRQADAWRVDAGLHAVHI